jgi:hypothetical protein
MVLSMTPAVDLKSNRDTTGRKLSLSSQHKTIVNFIQLFKNIIFIDNERPLNHDPM